MDKTLDDLPGKICTILKYGLDQLVQSNSVPQIITQRNLAINDSNVSYSEKLLFLSQMFDPLADVIGDVRRIGKSVVLASLPLNPLYIIELMIYPSSAASLLRLVQ